MERAPIFPIRLEPDSSGRVGWRSNSGDVVLKSAATNLCAFPKGYMFRAEYYGVDTNSLLENPNNDVTSFILYRNIKEAFESFEPRLTLVSADLTRDTQGKLTSVVRLEVNNTTGTEIEITNNYEVD